MPERKHAGAPDAVLARPLSFPSYPVATGRPLPGHQRPRALRVRKGVKAGDRKSLNLNPGGPIRSSSIAPAKPINQNFAAPDSSAPTRQGIKRTSPKNAGEKARRRPDAVLARPISLASYPVATGRPLPGHQRPRALRVMMQTAVSPPTADREISRRKEIEMDARANDRENP